MIKYICFGLALLCLFNFAAHAGPEGSGRHKQELGFGFGALLGGIVAGPPGAILGAAGGAWLGDRSEARDSAISTLEQRLQAKQVELAYLREEFSAAQSQYNNRLQRVMLDERTSVLGELVQGVNLTLYFRTNGADIHPDDNAKIGRLAGYLKDFPEIRVHLEGHADHRGPAAANTELSRRRSAAVADVLVHAGLAQSRIQIHSHGESQAAAAPGDVEGYLFDRRVNIHLSIDTEA